mgnify:CR=1 FL=1
MCDNDEDFANPIEPSCIGGMKIAKTIKSILKSKSKIIKTKRIGKMPHGGYRAFNTELSSKMFPSIKYTPIYSGFSRVIKS